jgi:hypothetical protein
VTAGNVLLEGAALEESPDTAGQDARETEAAKADGKWNRKETAGPGNRVGKGERVG